MSAEADRADVVTALDVLGPDRDTTKDVRDWLGTRDRHHRSKDALFHLSGATQDEAVRQIGSALNLQLGRIDIRDLLIKGWSSYEALIRAGTETAAAPDIRQIVEIASHTMEWAERISVHVSVDDVPVGEVDLEVKADLKVQALVAVVGRGRLLAVRSGRCDATVSVTVGPTQKTSHPMTLNLERLIVIPLGRGIPLVQNPPDH